VKPGVYYFAIAYTFICSPPYKRKDTEHASLLELFKHVSEKLYKKPTKKYKTYSCRLPLFFTGRKLRPA